MFKDEYMNIITTPIKAPGEDRTRDLSLTKRTHYHYATEANAAIYGREDYL